MLNENYLKNNLDNKCKLDLDNIISGKYLGLSRNVRQINSLFSRICKTYGNDKSKLLEIIKIVSDYLVVTRGKNTPSIKNAIVSMQLKFSYLHGYSLVHFEHKASWADVWVVSRTTDEI